MRNVAILGGGISGLAAAYYLERERRAGAAVRWTLFESSDRLGGVVATDHQDGFRIERGPDSFLTMKPSVSDLAKEMGIGDEMRPSLNAKVRTHILLNGKLIGLPEGMQMMVPGEVWPIVTSPLFSLSTKLRMAWEWLAPPEPLADDQDESVASFVERHFGREVLDRVASPLLAGVFGGDASNLSARAVLPMMLAMEKKYGSLARGAMASQKQKHGTGGSIFTTFRNGMQQFTDAIVDRLDPARIELRAPVREVHRYYDQWRVVTADGRLEMYHNVIIALPSFVASDVLQKTDTPLAAELAAIPYASCMTVALAYDKKTLPALPEGYGFLVPSTEGRRMMACTFVGHKFPDRVPEGGALIRTFFTEGIELSDEDTVSLARKELQEILGITVAPRFCKISRWPRAMAQYTVGHIKRVEGIQQMLQAHSGLHLIGAAYRGIGMPDCVREAKETALGILVG